MNKIVDRILSDICLDERVSDGIFNIENNDHMEVLREYLSNKGVPENLVVEFSNLVLEKGKHPERQAYNKSGILVTFPTPEYKQRAIQRGTHFEQNPVAGSTNLFGGGQQAPQEPIPTTPQPSPEPSQPAAPTNGGTPPDATPEPSIEKGGEPSELPQSDSSQQAPPTAPAQGQLQVQPTTSEVPTPPNVTPPPAPPQPPVQAKTPEQKLAEKETIKQIINTDDMGPNVPGLSEQLRTLTKIAADMNLMEAVKFLVNNIKD